MRDWTKCEDCRAWTERPPEDYPENILGSDPFKGFGDCKQGPRWYFCHPTHGCHSGEPRDELTYAEVIRRQTEEVASTLSREMKERGLR